MDDEFRDEVAAILRGRMPQEMEVVDTAEPASRGWLRRSEYDLPGLLAWEQPDGRMVVIREA